MKKILITMIAATVALCGTAFAGANAPVGAELLEKRCSVCHESSRPKSKKKTPDEWTATVTRMMDKGAQLTADEKKILIDHLSKTYKP